jgi:hypothetical protein
MDYSESANGVTISKARAYKELQIHGLADDWALFISDIGNSKEYKASDVLSWLGY